MRIRAGGLVARPTAISLLGGGMRAPKSAIAAALPAIVVTLTATLLVTVLATPAFAAGGKVRVRITGANNGQDVSNGGVAGRGRFTASGAITATGKVVAYRTVRGPVPGGVITLRFVATSAKGAITFVVKIDTGTGSSRWKITSATRRYRGLHGAGTETENAEHTVSILTGTVWR